MKHIGSNATGGAVVRLRCQPMHLDEIFERHLSFPFEGSEFILDRILCHLLLRLRDRLLVVALLFRRCVFLGSCIALVAAGEHAGRPFCPLLSLRRLHRMILAQQIFHRPLAILLQVVDLVVGVVEMTSQLFTFGLRNCSFVIVLLLVLIRIVDIVLLFRLRLVLVVVRGAFKLDACCEAARLGASLRCVASVGVLCIRRGVEVVDQLEGISLRLLDDEVQMLVHAGLLLLVEHDLLLVADHLVDLGPEELDAAAQLSCAAAQTGELILLRAGLARLRLTKVRLHRLHELLRAALMPLFLLPKVFGHPQHLFQEEVPVCFTPLSFDRYTADPLPAIQSLDPSLHFVSPGLYGLGKRESGAMVLEKGQQAWVQACLWHFRHQSSAWQLREDDAPGSALVILGHEGSDILRWSFGGHQPFARRVRWPKLHINAVFAGESLTCSRSPSQDTATTLAFLPQVSSSASLCSRVADPDVLP
mmetsp:Transcript_9327/g.34917  ORF Transcript_9327/g.34917 Transcript_9327/m.34917 type:complete len:475 (-) Transcript_9327:35-1459(-)